ncbi:MAG: LysM peptidoglycan-binding domain-containing protein [Acidimicrobiales bacterium]
MLAGLLLASTAPTLLDATPAAAGTVHVGRGEDLTQIAARYHTTVAALAATNGITNTNLVEAGAVLQLPTTGSSGSVTVGAGGDLTQIARRNGTTASALAAANDITNLNLVYAGEVLELPGGGGAGASAESVGPTIITVGVGEDLTQIAAQHGTTVATLVAINAISDPNDIHVGQHLLVPESTMQLASYSAPASGGVQLPAQLLAHPTRLALTADFTSAASIYGVHASLLEALCWWESGWQTGVVSTTGAIGVCQIEPSTASFVEQVLYPDRSFDVNSAAGNIAIGAAYLHHLLVRTGDNESLAIAAYYQGLQSVEQQGMLPTTRNYVNGIVAYAAIFAAAG